MRISLRTTKQEGWAIINIDRRSTNIRIRKEWMRADKTLNKGAVIMSELSLFEEAKRRLDLIISRYDMCNNAVLAIQGKEETICKLYEEWILSKDVKDSSKRIYLQAISNIPQSAPISSYTKNFVIHTISSYQDTQIRTNQKRLDRLKSFAKYLYKTKKINAETLQSILDVELPKAKTDYIKKGHSLSQEEINKLFSYCPKNQREELTLDIAKLEYYSGQRFSDVFSLYTPKKDGYITIIQKKRGKEVTIPKVAYSDIIEILSKYSNRVPVVDDSYTCRILKKIAKKQGLDRLIKIKDDKGEIHTKPLYEVITTHCFRRSYADYMVNIRGNTPSDIAKTMGHSETRTLEKYYLTADNEQIADRIK